MATVQHSAITDPEIHEPKGVSTATAKHVYSADGAGSGTWQKIENTNLEGISADADLNKLLAADGTGAFAFVRPIASGGIYFSNTATPYTWSYSATYTKIAPTTVAFGVPIEATEATTSRITYTGSAERTGIVLADIFIKQATGADKEINIAIAKNGSVVTGSESVLTSKTGEWHTVTVMLNAIVEQNDYFEVFMKNNSGSGDVSVGIMRLVLSAHL